MVHHLAAIPIRAFLADCSASERTFKIICNGTHLQFLLTEVWRIAAVAVWVTWISCGFFTLRPKQVVPSLCSFNDEDQELWIEDPEEYVRRGYKFSFKNVDPRIGAFNILVDFVRVRACVWCGVVAHMLT